MREGCGTPSLIQAAHYLLP